MKLHKFNELRVVAKNCLNPKYNGKTFEIAFAECNEKGEPIIFVNVESETSPMPLMALDLKQIDYVKVYDRWIVQYYHSLNKTFLTLPYELEDKNLIKVATFDIYRKEKDILSLVM